MLGKVQIRITDLAVQIGTSSSWSKCKMAADFHSLDANTNNFPDILRG
jgi:hypothetical protein